MLPEIRITSEQVFNFHHDVLGSRSLCSGYLSGLAGRTLLDLLHSWDPRVALLIRSKPKEASARGIVLPALWSVFLLIAFFFVSIVPFCEVVSIATNTVYPGQRSSMGGDGGRLSLLGR